MKIKPCNIEEIDRMIMEDDLEIVMTLFVTSPNRDGKIINNHTVIYMEKGNVNWHSDCVEILSNILKCNDIHPSFGVMV